MNAILNDHSNAHGMVCIRARLLTQFHSLRKSEGQRGFRRQHNVFVAGECGPGSPSARACCRANGSAFAASGQCADQGSCASAPANKSNRSLAFAFKRAGNRCSFHLLLPSVDADGIEPYLQPGATFEMSHAFGIHDCTAGSGSLLDNSFSLYNHRLCNGSRKTLPGLAVFGTQALSQPHYNHGAGRYGGYLSG
jgi:hypothetical protein